ncbi:hypothetical protein R6Q59_003048 [Mikania micrantha]
MSWVMEIFLLAFLPLLLAFLLVKSYFSWPKHYKNVPPSPPKLPIIGNLHQLGSVQLYRQVREDETTQIIRKIQEANGSVVNMTDLLVKLTNNLIARVASGKTYGFQHTVHRIAKATTRFSVGNYFPSFTWMDRLSGLLREADEIFKESDDLFEGVIEEHVNKKDFGIKGHDLVDILLEIQKDKSIGFELERYMIKAIILVTFI